MQKLKYQMTKLLSLSAMSSFRLGGVWVALLAARGFSMVEIGIAEDGVYLLLTGKDGQFPVAGVTKSFNMWAV